MTLLEKRGQLGGRAYSVVDEATGDIVDNGQHLFMGCYRATRAFLTRIGTADKLALQERLRIAFVDGDSGRFSRQRASAAFAAASAPSRSMRYIALSLGSQASMRAKQPRTTSTGDSPPAAYCAAT